ncbi:PAS domain S-box protein [Ferviditalea candida]|uniref:PAS domain S-box protein n=1 Tax=Ferviditalea candida TaxID=3108399 RepID=A0ABU5ZH64_9BACL|nr:PAS domain S-box protein [Paenibacillaceae bacterium T2]
MEQYLNELIETVNSSVLFVDHEGTIVYCNRRTVNVAGMPESEIIGRFINDVFPDSKLMDCIRTGEYHFGQKVKMKGVTYVVHRRPVFFNQRIVGGLSVFHDITEVEELKTDLNFVQSLNKQLDSIIHSSYDGIFISDGKGNGIKVNQAYERITGVKPEELLGKNMKELFL